MHLFNDCRKEPPEGVVPIAVGLRLANVPSRDSEAHLGIHDGSTVSGRGDSTADLEATVEHDIERARLVPTGKLNLVDPIRNEVRCFDTERVAAARKALQSKVAVVIGLCGRVRSE
jgi:hypothetical protein